MKKIKKRGFLVDKMFLYVLFILQSKLKTFFPLTSVQFGSHVDVMKRKGGRKKRCEVEEVSGDCLMSTFN